MALNKIIKIIKHNCIFEPTNHHNYMSNEMILTRSLHVHHGNPNYEGPKTTLDYKFTQLSFL